MGFDLYSDKGGSYYVNIVGWCKLLELAYESGWHPMGTSAPSYWKLLKSEPRVSTAELDIHANPVVEGCDSSEEAPSWNGSYFSNDYQGVIEADAKALGAALMRLATTLAGEDLSECDGEYYPPDLIARIANARAPGDPDPLWVAAFARFALKGSFIIG